MKFMSMLWMDVDTFHWLCEQVGPYIEREDTNYRDAIKVEKCLSIILNYLAVGACNKILVYIKDEKMKFQS